MSQRPSSFYEFGPFRINVTERLLQRGDQLVALSPKVFDTLLILVENHGHVVEKRELMELLWPNTFVEESSLTQNISLLRRALTTSETDQQYIETLPKRGYRFIADVRQINESTNGVDGLHTTFQASSTAKSETNNYSFLPVPEKAALKDNPQLWSQRLNLYVAVVGACVLVAALITFGYRFKHRRTSGEGLAGKSIAVLPFKTIGDESENHLLGLGMADALIIRLSRLEELTVLPTGSVFRFVERDKDAIGIGRELGVDGVLDGTIQREGSTVRVTAQLIRISDGKTLWSVKYDERQSNMFALQDSISEQLAVSLIPEISASKKQSLWVKSTANPEAYQDYLLGMHFWNRRTPENLPRAIQYLEQAVAKDPNFAQAHAILADCYFLGGTEEYRSMARDEAIKRAQTSANRALELDDSIVEAHTVKASLHTMQREYQEADAEFRKAITLNPNYAVAHLRYGYFLMWELRIEEGISHMRRAQQLDPTSPVTNAALGSILLTARQIDESIKYSQRALELEPSVMAARINLVEAQLEKGMFDVGIRELERLPDTDQYVLSQKAYAYAVSGRRNEALATIALLGKRFGEGGLPYTYAKVYGALGDKDKAFAWLERVSLTRMMQANLLYDSQLDTLRSDPRFNDFLKRHQLEHLLAGTVLQTNR